MVWVSMKLQLRNIREDVWSERFILLMECPYCEVTNEFWINITKKSIRLDCKNPQCNKVFFYRRINLGSIEK